MGGRNDPLLKQDISKIIQDCCINMNHLRIIYYTIISVPPDIEVHEKILQEVIIFYVLTLSQSQRRNYLLNNGIFDFFLIKNSSIGQSFKHVDLLADRIFCLQTLRQELSYAFLPFLDLELGQHECGERAHPQVLCKPPILRQIFVDVVRQFPAEDEKRALTLSHLLEQVQQLFISSNIRVDCKGFAPFFDPVMETTNTFESSTCLVCVREGQHSCQFCVSIIWHFVTLTKPFCELYRVVIVVASPIFACGLNYFCPPPRVDVEVIQTA